MRRERMGWDVDIPFPCSISDIPNIFLPLADVAFLPTAKNRCFAIRLSKLLY